METTVVTIPPEGARIPFQQYDVVIEDQFWVVRPRNGHTIKPFITPEIDPEDAEMERQEDAYKTLYPTLKETHLGQYVAIHKEKVVDSDTDRVALRIRLDDLYPNSVICVRLVEETLPRTLRMPMSFYRFESVADA